MKKTDAPLSLLQWKMLRWLAGGDAGQRSIFQPDGGDIFIFGADFRKEALRAAAESASPEIVRKAERAARRFRRAYEQARKAGTEFDPTQFNDWR
ncbi:hypothetical protein H8Z75_23545 (plasmid) [Xanthomonas citri pv. citri]|nr:hypothetical protein H8Z75_23545 [Xanthomonas citri pv. citri]